MVTLAQMSKEITRNQQQLFMQINHLGSHLEQVKHQVGHLSSRIDNLETSSSRSRSQSRSRHSSQHRPVPSESPKVTGLPITVEDVEDVDRHSFHREKQNYSEPIQTIRYDERHQSSTHMDDLEKSLHRTRNERLFRASLPHSEEATLPVLPYRRPKVEEESRNFESHFEPKRSSTAATPAAISPITPLVQGSFYKLSANLLGSWDPAVQPTHAFTASIMQARSVYGDTAVVAAIPIALSGRAKKWFRSLNTELHDPRMNTVEGWVDFLEKAFPVDRIKMRREARSRRYVPAKDDSVMDYVWDKVELLRAAKRDISEEDLIEEIWMGLPSEIRLTFDNEGEILDSWTVQKLSNALIPKDRAFRATLRREAIKKEPTSYSRVDRSSRFATKTPADDRRKSDTRSDNLNEETRPSVDEKRKWKKDDNGKWLSRTCRHCNEWHLDSNCPKRPSNYYLTDQLVADSDVLSDEHGINTIPPDTESDSDSHPHYHTLTNGYRHIVDPQSVIIKNSRNIPIVELSPADVIGTGIAYLSAEPCPVRASLGAPPDANTPIKSGVVDSGGACIIPQENVPPGIQILKSPLNPSFQGVGDSSTETIGYAKIPTYFPNQAAFNEDKRHAKILLLWIEYQIVAKCRTAFLIGRDALKAYSIDIEESSKNVVVRVPNEAPFRIPITETDRFAVRHHDSRVFLTEDAKIKPRQPRKVDHSLAEKAKPPDSPTSENLDPFGLSDKSGEESEGESARRDSPKRSFRMGLSTQEEKVVAIMKLEEFILLLIFSLPIFF